MVRGHVVEDDTGYDSGCGDDSHADFDDPPGAAGLPAFLVSFDAAHAVTSFGRARLQTPLLGVIKGAIM
jgi:hypothetical protein